MANWSSFLNYFKYEKDQTKPLDPNRPFALKDGDRLHCGPIRKGNIVRLRNESLAVVTDYLNTVPLETREKMKDLRDGDYNPIAWIRLGIIPGLNSGMYIDESGRSATHDLFDIVEVIRNRF